MPIRAFVTKDFDALTASGGIIEQLESALQNGNISQLRNNNTGWLTVSTILTADNVRMLYNQARYEAYLRVISLPDADNTKAAKLLLWTDPWKEAVMFVEPNRSGYCYPTSCP